MLLFVFQLGSYPWAGEGQRNQLHMFIPVTPAGSPIPLLSELDLM